MSDSSLVQLERTIDTPPFCGGVQPSLEHRLTKRVNRCADEDTLSCQTSSCHGTNMGATHYWLPQNQESS
ncbi:hypothetical protein ACIQT7_13325 [Agrobacterium deltaense]